MFANFAAHGMTLQKLAGLINDNYISPPRCVNYRHHSQGEVDQARPPMIAKE
jgi:hypothetical protein